MPAAAVIPAPVAYIQAAAVKKFVVLVSPRGADLSDWMGLHALAFLQLVLALHCVGSCWELSPRGN